MGNKHSRNSKHDKKYHVEVKVSYVVGLMVFSCALCSLNGQNVMTDENNIEGLNFELLEQ